MLCQTQASTIQKCIFFLQSLPWFGRVARHSLLDINHASCCLPLKDSNKIESWGNGNQIYPHENSVHIVLGILEKLFILSTVLKKWKKIQYKALCNSTMQCKKNSERKSSWPPNDSNIPLTMSAENYRMRCYFFHILIRILSFTLKMLKHSYSVHKSSWLHLASNMALNHHINQSVSNVWINWSIFDVMSHFITTHPYHSLVSLSDWEGARHVFNWLLHFARHIRKINGGRR